MTLHRCPGHAAALPRPHHVPATPTRLRKPRAPAAHSRTRAPAGCRRPPPHETLSTWRRAKRTQLFGRCMPAAVAGRRPVAEVFHGHARASAHIFEAPHKRPVAAGALPFGRFDHIARYSVEDALTLMHLAVGMGHEALQPPKPLDVAVDGLLRAPRSQHYRHNNQADVACQRLHLAHIPVFFIVNIIPAEAPR